MSKGPLYLIYVGGKREFLVSLENPNGDDEFMDVYNGAISNETGLAHLKFRLIDLLEPVTGKSIRNDPEFAYEYARDVIDGRFLEGEPAIVNSDYAYDYANDVIGGRWPEGEPAIAKDAYNAYYYAVQVIGGRWPEAEPAIAKSPSDAYKYARDVIKGRFPEGEPAIVNSDYADDYARDVIKTT